MGGQSGVVEWVEPVNIKMSIAIQREVCQLPGSNIDIDKVKFNTSHCIHLHNTRFSYPNRL